MTFALVGHVDVGIYDYMFDELDPTSILAFEGARRLGARLCFDALKDRSFEAGNLAFTMDAISHLSVFPGDGDEKMHLAIQTRPNEEIDEGFMARVSESPDALRLFMFALSGTHEVAEA